MSSLVETTTISSEIFLVYTIFGSILQLDFQDFSVYTLFWIYTAIRFIGFSGLYSYSDLYCYSAPESISILV